MILLLQRNPLRILPSSLSYYSIVFLFLIVASTIPIHFCVIISSSIEVHNDNVLVIQHYRSRLSIFKQQQQEEEDDLTIIVQLIGNKGLDCDISQVTSIVYNNTNNSNNNNNRIHKKRSSLSTKNEMFNYTRSSYETIIDEFTGRIASTIWHGELLSITTPKIQQQQQQQQQSIGSATFIMNHKNGYIYGTFRTISSTYSLIKIIDNDNKNNESTTTNSTLYYLIERKWKNLPSSISPNNEDDNIIITKENPVSYSSLSPLQIENTERIGYVQTTTSYHNSMNNKIPLVESILQPKYHHDLQYRSLQSKTTTTPIYIDIMILITNRAMCEYAKLSFGCIYNDNTKAPIENKIYTVISETNKIYKDLFINIIIRIVDIKYILASNELVSPLYFYSNSTLSLHLIETDNGVKIWRNESGADLVHMITGTSNKCGIARTFHTNSNLTNMINKYYTASTSYNCLDSYSFQTQLGTNFGCYINREDSGTIQTLYSHGYKNNTNLIRTIMSEDCIPNSCPKLPYYSTNEFVLSNNRIIGNETNDNVRQIRISAPIIEQYKVSIIPLEPSDDENNLTCNNDDDSNNDNNTKSPFIGFFITRNCKQRNMIHRRIGLFKIICVNVCISETLIDMYINVLGYSCGACNRRFNFG